MFGSCTQRGPRYLSALLSLAACFWLAASLATAQQSRAKSDPAVLIGPSRVTLAGGKTIDGIAVFREPTRVRVVLEDGTEIAFDPAKVVSVVALADLPEAPPTPPPSKTPSTARKSGKAGPPAKVHAEPKGGDTTPGSRTARSKPGSKGASVDSGTDEAEAATARQKEERQKEIEELAAMLQSAIANAALEGIHTGGPEEGAGEDGSSPGTTGADATAPADSKESSEAETAKKAYKPKPEDFDATLPVNKAGYRFLGPKGQVPDTPPQTDFPAPAAEPTSLGFKRDTWKPSSGFSSVAKWPSSLPPATSFSNRLSGLDQPSTSLGPHWWGPSPTRWSPSIFSETWKPQDGFAQDKERKDASKPQQEAPPANQNK